MSKGMAGFGRHVATVIAFFAVFVAFIGLVLTKSGAVKTPGSKYKVQAILPSASLLTPGARVTAAGAQIGIVKKVERADDVGPGAKVTLQITDDQVFPLPRDSRVQVRTRSQVGENYVAIVVGKDQVTIPDGATIGLQQADELVNVDQILSVLQGKTRERTRTLLQEFGGALSGRGKALNHTLQGLNGTVQHGSALVDVLNRNRLTVARLVDQLGSVGASVGERGAAIDTIAHRGVTALRAIGEQDAALAETLRELPSTLDKIRDTTRTVGSVSDRATPVVADLATATEDLGPAITDLAAAARDGRQVVRYLGPALPDVSYAVRGADAAGRAVTKAVPGIKGMLCQLNPMLRYILPYKDDLLQIAFHLSSASHAYDATGHTVRLLPILNENSLSGAPPAVLDSARLLLQSGLFTGQTKRITYDPYMKPGTIGKTVAQAGQPVNMKTLGDSGYKYPHVEADC
jgi:phospholipid/cholesterol/gamma-HCH transport system substrate-binding protein